MKWVFDRQPASGVQTGGGVADHLFPRSIDSFVRETTQNSNDQRRSSDEPVLVKFAIHSLTGEFAQGFLDHIGWPDLKKHLTGAAATKSLSRRRIERALNCADDLDAGFNVLVLSDHNTYGLYGDERASEPNFSNLVRHQLMTSDGHASRGGTYGLGKSVLWAFSDISTVLFHSLPTTKPDVNGQASPDLLGSRFIGRASLVSHLVNTSEFDPNGLFGESVNDNQGREWSRSVRGVVADTALPKWLLPQRVNPDDTGTSVVIPFFGAPGRSGPEATSQETCRTIADALNVWYWPAIQSAHLIAQVEQFDNGVSNWFQAVNGISGVENFVAAWSMAQDKVVNIAKEDSQVAERQVDIDAPKTTTQVPNHLKHDKCTAPARLRIIRTEGSDASRAGTVALVRGAGMVVKYLKPPALGVDIPAFVGVLEAGMRHTEPTPFNVHIERFLKAAEPYAHDDWIPNTDRVAQDYQQGAGVALSNLKVEIARKLAEALKPDAGDNADGPERLSRRFDLAGDTLEMSGRLTMKNITYDSAKQTWSLDATMTLAKKKQGGPWRFTGTIEIENQFGANELLEIVSTKVLQPDEATCATTSPTEFKCEAPAGSRDATIHLVVSASKTSIPTILRERVALSVVAQTELGGS